MNMKKYLSLWWCPLLGVIAGIETHSWGVGLSAALAVTLANAAYELARLAHARIEQLEESELDRKKNEIDDQHS